MAKSNNLAAKKATATNTPKNNVADAVAAVAGKLPSVKTLAIILAVVAFIFYANTINNGFVLDDLMVAQGNTMVNRGVSAIPEILTTPYLRGYFVMPNDTYRPLSLVMLAIENQLFGINPTVNHFMSVVFFVLGVVFLFLFLNQLFEGRRTGVAFVAALLFAAHPIHTEVVANVKSRDELLCFLFGLWSLYLFTRYAASGKVKLLAAGAACFFLSLISKETSVFLLVMIPIIFYFFLNSDGRRSTSIVVSSVLVAIAFLGIRFAVLKANHADDAGYLHFIDNQLVKAPDFGSRIATATFVLGKYIKMLFIPAPLICSYAFNSVPTVGFGNLWVILSFVVYVALTGYSIFRMKGNRKDPYAFGILFYILPLGIVSNYFFLIGSACAERFLFFGSVGFCLILALLLDFWIARTTTGVSDLLLAKKVWMVVAPVVLVFFVLTMNRNAEWKDNYTLFSADVLKAPENARLNYYLGNEMSTNYAAQAPDPVTKGQIMEQSVVYMQKAVAIYPEFYEAHVALGSAFFNLKKYDSAEVHHKITLKDDPQNILALNGLAGIYFMKQNYPAARDILIRDVAINPRSTDIVHNLGLCYMYMQKFDSAQIYFRMALAVDPTHKESLKNMARTYRAMNVPDSLRKYLALAQSAEPGFRVE